MRRKDRELKQFEELIRVIEKCDVCRLALHDEEYPYILPLNFGMEVSGQNIVFYFHGASEGKKLELLRKDNRVGFEMDCSHKLVTDIARGSYSMEYESVVGHGRVEIVGESEKAHALHILMKQYQLQDFPIDEAAIPRTTLLKLTVESITGKANLKK